MIPNAQYVDRGTYDLKKVCLSCHIMFHSFNLVIYVFISIVTHCYFQIVEYANNREFTSVMVVHTNRREPGKNSSISFSFSFHMFLFLTPCVGIFVIDALLIINLPEGPTAHFKLSKLVLRKDIKVLCLYLLLY